ncbi:MAG: ATP synthase F1 subunit delta [Lentimicrobiaceae bacterium]|jgi:F-type H+-transporting ATPase subunit delta|nr:ATP synthase F1 subunit delta [Lentimicrobiaceae bacterium]
MKDILLAKRYAKSLFELSIEKGELEEVNNDMALIARVMRENKELRTIIGNNVIRRSKKENIIRKIFETHIQPSTLTFLYFLINKKRENHLYTVTLVFLKMYLDYKNIVIATITTAVAIDEETKTEILNRFSRETDKTIQIENKINPKILGGFVMTLDDYQYDASIKKMIDRLQTEFKVNLFKKGF